jgi:hypothetical protein
LAGCSSRHAPIAGRFADVSIGSEHEQGIRVRLVGNARRQVDHPSREMADACNATDGSASRGA